MPERPADPPVTGELEIQLQCLAAAVGEARGTDHPVTRMRELAMVQWRSGWALRAAIAKVSGRVAYADFRGWLSSAAGVPRGLAGPLAAGTVALEGATAAAIAVPALAPAGFAVAALLLVVFSASVRSMMRRRVGVPCRCFGAGTRPPGPLHLARNGALLAVAAAGGALTSTAGTAWPPAPGTASFLAVVSGATAALLLINLDEIVALYRP